MAQEIERIRQEEEMFNKIQEQERLKNRSTSEVKASNIEELEKEMNEIESSRVNDISHLHFLVGLYSRTF